MITILRKPGYILNSDDDKLNRILEKIEANDGECPCPNPSKNKKCPCDLYRERGICRCGLYLKLER